jgi:beta-1,4-mannosyl-glycoprotein beta-1,4-N-acetylglucosaminyltransferase
MIYDCFTFFNELDLLEIRLNMLDEHVDYFILAESTETFSGLEKPLYYGENKERFSKWNHKIIHHVNDKFQAPDSFQRAHFQKEGIAKSMTNVSDDDIVYYGDLDEIWKPQTIEDDNVYKLKQLNYVYYLNNRSSEQWIGTLVGRWGSIRERGFNYHRGNPSHFKENGGWHFTSMGGADQVRKKLEAYDHQEYNLPWLKENMEQRIEMGLDFAGRPNDWQGKPFSFRVDESELPEFVLNNKEKYSKYFKK